MISRFQEAFKNHIETLCNIFGKYNIFTIRNVKTNKIVKFNKDEIIENKLFDEINLDDFPEDFSWDIEGNESIFSKMYNFVTIIKVIKHKCR